MPVSTNFNQAAIALMQGIRPLKDVTVSDMMRQHGSEVKVGALLDATAKIVDEASSKLPALGDEDKKSISAAREMVLNSFPDSTGAVPSQETGLGTVLPTAVELLHCLTKDMLAMRSTSSCSKNVATNLRGKYADVVSNLVGIISRLLKST